MSSSSFPNWRELHAERLAEAIEALSTVSGVRGLVLGGSVARGDHWPLSDIDLFPIWRVGEVDDQAMAEQQAGLIDWWAASGRAQTLDVSWLRFEDQEVARAISGDAEYAAKLMSEPRWFHGLDKMFGGRGVADPDGVAHEFAQWVSKMRFEPAVIAARVQRWLYMAHQARDLAVKAHAAGDAATATIQLRSAARGLRLVLLEGWGERLGSMGREWTLWERMARDHGADELAQRLAELASASPGDALQRAQGAPIWLQERIHLAFEARRQVGEMVSEEESARDQLAAFAVHVTKRQRPPWDAWLRVPEDDVDERLDVLDELIEQVRSDGPV